MGDFSMASYITADSFFRTGRQLPGLPLYAPAGGADRLCPVRARRFYTAFIRPAVSFFKRYAERHFSGFAPDQTAAFQAFGIS